MAFIGDTGTLILGRVLMYCHD